MEQHFSAEQLNVIADPSKRIPKYCTNVLVQKLSNGHVIVSFLQNDSASVGEKVSMEGAVLIERILLDSDHVGKVLDALRTVVEDSSKK